MLIRHGWLLVFTLCLAQASIAADQIRIVGGQSDIDRRHVYPHALLMAALEATVAKDGPYTVVYNEQSMTRDRALNELIAGDLINVHSAPTQSEWESAAIPVRIPLRKGLLGYRLFLIRADREKLLAQVHDIDELKFLSAGLGAQWSTTLVMRELGFRIETGGGYESLFQMLMAGRFDYFPRGVNEIFDEYDLRKKEFPNLMIEPTKALYFTTPTYLFVSPKYPELADRLYRGLLRIIEDGTFESLFIEYNEKFIQRARLNERQIFRVNNPLLSPETPIDNPVLWYSPQSGTDN